MVAVAGVVGGVAVFLLVLQVAGPRSTEQAQQAEFEVGSASNLASAVERGGPLLFQDLLGGSRDVLVHHFGGDDWRAFEAHAPGAARSCVLEWRAPAQRFADPCDGRTYPPDGSALTTFPTRVDRGTVVVNLRAAQAPGEATTTGR